MRISASRRVAIWLEHRSHLQQAHMEMLAASFVRLLEQPKWRLALRYLWERFRPGPRRLFSTIARGCKIHPTAIVEGCTLGAGCEIGAYAIVRGCVLGENVTIEDGTHVQMSAVGDRSHITRQNSIFASVLMEDTHSSQELMQVSVLGRNTTTAPTSGFVDFSFHGAIKVQSDDGQSLLDSGTRFLGCDVGHNVFVGSRTTVAAGRMLPSNTKLVSDPKDSLLSLGEVNPRDGGDALYVIRDGRLVKLQ